jgi:hypothetical protein
MWRDLDPRVVEPERPLTSRLDRVSDDHDDRAVTDPRDVFTRALDLPRTPSREYVYARGRSYRIRSSEARTLATVGAFRIVPATDLRGHDDRPGDSCRGDLWHLRESGLIRTSAFMAGRTATSLVTLTEDGRALLEASRESGPNRDSQRFYAGFRKRRELAHDAQLYRAYLRSAERLVERGAKIRRVVLDYELKGDYQRFLQEPNRGQPHSDGRPQRTSAEIERWADEHELPLIENRVRFPDVRIEYDDRDGRQRIEDVEVVTRHYRGAHASQRNRFACHRAEPDPHIAGEFL